MIELKIYTDKGDGSEEKKEWKLYPLLDLPEPIIHREEGDSIAGSSRGRALWAKEVRKITLSADTTLYPDTKELFVRLLLAKRLELKRKRDGKWVWVPFTLVLDREVAFEYLEDITELKRREITLTETDPRWYDQFADIIKDSLTNYSIID